MKTIYYKIIITYCDYPFMEIIDEKYVEFYEKTKSKGLKRYKKIDGLRIDSNTSIEEKKEYLKKELSLNEVDIIKLKF